MTLVFVDTETTSLRPDRRAWDIALIVRRPGEPDREYQWFVDDLALDLGNADPFALKIGRFYERHPAAASPFPDTLPPTPRSAMLAGPATSTTR